MQVPLQNRVLSVEQMRSVDDYTIRKIGLPGPVLMENAGRAVADEAVQLLEENSLAEQSRILILCGGGNNGGDGLVAARHLVRRGYRVSCLNLFKKGVSGGDAGLQLKVAKALGLELLYLTDKKRIQSLILHAHLIIDAIFGSGLTRPVKGLAAEVIGMVNKSRRPVLAVDVPSGLNADDGQILGCAIKARLSVTFGFFKRGFFSAQGPEVCGELVLADISLATPPAILREKLFLSDEKTLAGFLPPRKKSAHKGSFGTLYTVCGSETYSGAAVLAGSAALRAGVGLLIMGLDGKTHRLVKARLDEAVGDVLPALEQSEPKKIVDKILAGSQKASAFLIGSGLGRPKAWGPVLKELLPRLKKPMVLDADALNALGKEARQLLRKCKAPVVITPHPGEFGRLCGLTTTQVQARRLSLAASFAAECGQVVLLKGHYTVIASPEGETWLNVSGNPGLASGGSGDVLAGLLGAYLAQGVDPLTAARAAAFVQGAAGDLAAEQVGEVALVAGDLLAPIISLQKSLSGK